MPDTPQDPVDFLQGGGETGSLIRARDWSSTSLGPMASWPQCLKTAVAIVVRSTVPIVMLWGQDGVMLYNDAYSVFAGGRHPRLLGSKVREGWPEVADFNDHVMTVGLAGGTLAYRDQELTLYRNGSAEQVWMNLDYSPVLDERGLPAGVIAIVVETTERVLADRRLAAERDRLRAMFEQAPGFMAMFDGPDHVISLVNPAYLTLIGRTGIVGRRVRDAIPEVAGQGYFELLDEVYRTGKPSVGTGTKVSLRRQADGAIEDRFVDFVYQPITGDDGAVTGLFLQGSDVTDRVLGEIARRESEDRFREIADAAPVLIWMADSMKSATWFNKPWLDFVGTEMERELGSGWSSHIHPDDLARCIAAYEEAWTRRAPFRSDLRVRRHDGEYRVIDDTGVPRFAEDGAFLGYIGCGVDVTDARNAAAELRRFTDRLEARVDERTAELAAANRQLVAQIEERERMEATLRQMQRLEAVGQLTSGVAHDFNNLLTVILGNIAFLEGAYTKRVDDQKVLTRLGHMKTAAKRGATLTGQLLAFSRRQRLEATPVDLNETVAGMRDLLESSMGGSVGLDFVFKPDLWSALVDATQIELVILNLAINGRDAMEVGGSLRLETGNVVLGEPRRPEDPRAGEYVMVAVTDTGSGMTAEVLAKAYEPFFTTKPVGKGSGLGLAQVFGFAKQSGGGVAIETKLGSGTTVKVYLPRAAKAGVRDAAAADPVSPAGIAGIQRRVLVVDDDSAVREVTATMLRELGCSVIEAGSGGAALDLLEREPQVDLVVLDFAMPGMNGSEVAREIHARRPGTPTLFVTGYADTEALESVGEDWIVQKPFDGIELSVKVSRIFGEVDRIDDENGEPIPS